MLTEDIDIYGHKEKLYQTLKWLWNDEMNSESTSLVYVRGVKDSGKSLFLRMVGRFFYQRNNFPFKISYLDFHTVDSPAKFKKVIFEMYADL
jgi:Cdc6-like AAA superfamily ATPase